MRTLSVAAGLLLGISCSSAPRERDAAVEARILKAVQDGDVRAAFEGLKEAFAAAEIPCNSVLQLRVQPFDVPLSNYLDELGLITISDMIQPGRGSAYWEAWNTIAAGGTWNLNRSFRGESDMRLTGNYAVLGILAHEIGHSLSDQYDVEPSERGLSELIADKIAVAMMRRLDRQPELKRLRERYVVSTITELRNAIPDGQRVDIPADQDLDAWCGANAPPSGIGPYVSLQLGRQKRLMTDPALESLEHFGRAALTEPYRRKTALLPAWKGRVEVRTIRPVPAFLGLYRSRMARQLRSGILGDSPDFIGFDSAGQLLCLMSGEAGLLTAIEKDGDLAFGGGTTLENLFKDKALASVDLMFACAPKSLTESWMMVGTLFEEDPTFLVHVNNGQARILKEFRPGVEYARIAVSPSGALVVMWKREKGGLRYARLDKGIWSEEKEAPIPNPSEIALDDQGRIYFHEGMRAVKVLENGEVRRVAGGLKSWQDGEDPVQAAFSNPGPMRVVGDTLRVFDRRMEMRDDRLVPLAHVRAIRLTPD